MKPLISVIVPVYNVEKYLDRCVRSIVNQSYQNLEIILVDDGSPDHCPEICDEWVKRDSRIIVIHKKNGGLSDARNKGMEIATGEYIGFVDSDDWISEKMYESLFQMISCEDADIAACGIQKVWGDKKIVVLEENISVSYTAQQALEELIIERGLQQVVWNKLYKRTLIQETYFPYGKCNEDEFWTYQIVGRAEKIVTLSNCYYFYQQRPDSIIGNRFSLKRLDALDAREERQRYIEKYYPDLSGVARLNLFYSCCYAYQISLRCLKKADFLFAQKYITEKMNKIVLRRADYKNEIWKQKLWISLYKISLHNTCRLRNILKIGL